MKRSATLLVALALTTAACAVPLAAQQPAGSAAGGASAAGSAGGAAQTRQILPITPTATAARPTAVLTATALLGDPVQTPLAPTVTPVVPPLPTLTLPPRPQLDAPSQAALSALQATAAAQSAGATATAAALPPQLIDIKDLAFAPATLTVPPGTTIVWRNFDRVLHQVRGGEFDSGRIQSGAYWASILSRPGVYQFLCSFHPTMRAEITVTTDDTRPIHLGS